MKVTIEGGQLFVAVSPRLRIFSREHVGWMSTTRCALLLLAVACSSKNSGPPPAEPCLPGEISSSAPGIASIDGVTAHACWGERCLTLDREGKATGLADRATTETAARAATAEISPAPPPVPVPLQKEARLAATSPSGKRQTVFSPSRVDVWDPKAQAVIASHPTSVAASQAHQVGDTHVMFRGAAGSPWTLLDLVAGTSITVGEPGWDLRVIDATTAAVFRGDKLISVDAARMAATTPFTLPGHVAMVTAWFDRVFVVLDHPAGTAQIDPKSGSFYAGAALPTCK